MKTLVKIVLLTAFSASALLAERNWTAPKEKIYAQALSEQIMAAHPELISLTFHGVPPGMTDAYTMFAGSYVDRIGNKDDPDDVMVSQLGITISDPRWHRTKDTVKKYVMMLPLRDAKGENCGLLVAAYHNLGDKSETDFFKMGVKLRDGLQKLIPSYEALYAPALK